MLFVSRNFRADYIRKQDQIFGMIVFTFVNLLK